MEPHREFVPADENLTICFSCRHYRHTGREDLCESPIRMSREEEIAPVSGKRRWKHGEVYRDDPRPPCDTINTDGRCSTFESNVIEEALK